MYAAVVCFSILNIFCLLTPYSYLGGVYRDLAGNQGANELTLSISLAEGIVESIAVQKATRQAATAASTGTVVALSVGSVAATTLAAGETGSILNALLDISKEVAPFPKKAS